jgi:gamma-tubulin complex component 2
LSQSSFLTHLLDLAHTELRKAAKSASIVKLQSLLDLALNTDVSGEDLLFREDVKVIVSVNGVIGGEEGDAEGGHVHEEHKKEKEKEKEKDEKKPMLGDPFRFYVRRFAHRKIYSHRCPGS